jgi:hypothetical protein
MSLKHIREAWGLRQNPFPAAAIAGEDSMNAPYNANILATDRDQFVEKLIVKAALPPGREFGYLWSQGRRDDTGFGKTTMMLHTAEELNVDFGQTIISEYDLPATMTMAGVWASMGMTGVTGIYPLLFNAISYAAQRTVPDQPSLLEKCWNAIAKLKGIDPKDTDGLSSTVEKEVRHFHRKLFPGHPAVRQDIFKALITCDQDRVLTDLSLVSQPGRARNGLAYFEAFYSLVRAAEIEHLFVFIDQLEDLATARNVPRATRQREVGRFRDIFAETSGFKGHCHAVFTFHNRAAQALADFWHLERLNPPFWPQDPMGRPAIVVLKGLTSTTQVETLLATYLDSVRENHTRTSAEPFEPSTFQVFLERSDGRIGLILAEAYSVLDQAADAGLPSISGKFITNNMPEQVDNEGHGETVSGDDTLEALWNPSR